jgi:hypothetical protein
MSTAPRTLIIACGALSHEIVALIRANGWDNFHVQCLPAELHNRPGEIPGAVRGKIRELREGYEHVFVAYADCGTGGQLDAVLADEGIERLPGAHCYEFFAGGAVFGALAEEEPGTFYLTDFLARHFDRLIIRGMGLDRHPQLQSMLFGNYRRLVYLAQREDPELERRAREAADRLALPYEYRYTGYGELGDTLAGFRRRTTDEKEVQWRPS